MTGLILEIDNPTYLYSVEAEVKKPELGRLAFNDHLHNWQSAYCRKKIKAIYASGTSKLGSDAGFAVVCMFADGSTHEIGGFERNSTKQRAELLAIIAALQFSANRRELAQIEFFSNSAYVCGGYLQVNSWLGSSWKTSEGRDVENQDLWERLEKLRSDIKFNHLTSHSDHSGKGIWDRRSKNYERYGELASQHNRGITRAEEIAAYCRESLRTFFRESGYLTDSWHPPVLLTASGWKATAHSDLRRESDALRAETDFETRITERALHQAKLEWSVFEANINFFDQLETFERLNWEIPKSRGFRLIPWSQSFGFINEDGTSFQHQLDVPRLDKKEKKPIKYESVKGKGAQVYLPSVPVDVRRKIAETWGVDVPLTGSFWHWFRTSEAALKLPLVVTEGGWKALSILSLGIPAISLYGCSAGFQKRDSKYDPRVLCVALHELSYKRRVIIAFDEDEKLHTRRMVNANINILGKALTAKKASIRVAHWDHEQGKGADDFIADQGGKAFFKVLDNAQPFTEWSKEGRKKFANQVLAEAAKLSADIVAKARWVSECNFPLPKPGEALLLDAAMSLGKTIAFAKIDEDLRKLYPDLEIVDLIGHRNNLLRQSAGKNRLNLEHITDLEAGAFTQSRIDASLRAAYCIDSLVRRYERLVRACQEGRKILIIIDEIDAVLTHLLTATTIAALRRLRLIAQLAVLLQLIGDGHGFLIGGEANLSGLAVRAIHRLSQGKLKITVCRNEYKPAQWQVFDHSLPDAASNKLHAVAFTEKCLQEGKKVLLLSSGQETAEQFEVILKGYGKIIRIDSTTSTDDIVRAIIENADVELLAQAPQLLIATPTIESGLSIDVDYFDVVVIYGGGLEPRSLFQMLGRPRKPVPRHLFIAATSQVRHGLNADRVLDKWESDISKAIEQHGLSSQQEIEAIEIAKEIAAEIIVRSEAGAMRLHDTVVSLLKKDGHIVVKQPFILEEEEEQAMRERIKEAKEVLADEFVKLWLSLNDAIFTPGEARKKLREELPRLEHLTAQKALERERYGAMVDDEAWIRPYWAYGQNSRSKRRSINTAALYAHPEIARELDQKTIQRQLEATGTVWSPSFSSKEAVVELLQKLQFDYILRLANGEQIHSKHWIVDFIFRQAQKHAVEVKEVLNLSITDDTKPMAFINDVLTGRLGAELKRSKVTLSELEIDKCPPNAYKDIPLGDFGGHLSPESPTQQVEQRKRRKKGTGKGERVNAYEIISFPYRQEMIDAIASHRAQQNEALEDNDVLVQEIPGQIVSLVGEEMWRVLKANSSELMVFPVEIENPGLRDAFRFSRAEIAEARRNVESQRGVA